MKAMKINYRKFNAANFTKTAINQKTGYR